MRSSHLVKPAGAGWPVFNSAVAATIISAVPDVLVAFGVPISDVRGNAITTLASAAAPFVALAFAARTKVTPLSKLVGNGLV